MAVIWKKLAYADDVVPYTGAISNTDLGTKTLASAGILKKQIIADLTVPDGYNMIQLSCLHVTGRLTLSGTARVGVL